MRAQVTVSPPGDEAEEVFDDVFGVKSTDKIAGMVVWQLALIIVAALLVCCCSAVAVGMGLKRMKEDGQATKADEEAPYKKKAVHEEDFDDEYEKPVPVPAPSSEISAAAAVAVGPKVRERARGGEGGRELGGSHVEVANRTNRVWHGVTENGP